MASAYSLCATCLRVTVKTTTRAFIKPHSLPRLRAYSRAIAATTQPWHRESLTPSTTRIATSSIPTIQRYHPLLTKPQTFPRRALATTSDASSAKPAQPIQNPRTDDSGNAMLISISPRASNRLHRIATTDNNPHLALRVSVESGGCHGFQYLMDLTDLSKTPATVEDTVFQGQQGEKIIIDEPSLELLNGSTVDYTMELIGSQFKVTGIPGATSSCGCGTSFDIKF